MPRRPTLANDPHYPNDRPEDIPFGEVEKIRKGAIDFNNRFSGVMKELAEEDNK